MYEGNELVLKNKPIHIFIIIHKKIKSRMNNKILNYLFKF